ncbi:MAG: efflux RND transporter periplasmic adaptor subunit [Candidatus Obscuribacterales bacterium]|nr:efflux RND transporter periplasmic adaptor subunit [Candidatus Obscuribacterales bacterium]
MSLESIPKPIEGERLAREFKTGFSKKRLFVFGGCALVLFFATTSVARLIFPANQNKKESAPPSVMTVTTVPVRYGTINRELSINGSIAAWDELAIGAEANGLRLDSVRVEEGNQVSKGQILATLNSAVLRAQLEQEKAKARSNEAALRKAIQPNRVEDLNSWRAALMQAEANVAQEEANLSRSRANSANAQENSRRYSELRKVGAVSQMEADNSLTAARAAESEVLGAEKKVLAMKFALRQAHEKLKMAEQGGRQEDVLISQSSLAESKARVKQLEAQVEQTIIRAPDSGVIVKRNAHLGEISSAGKELFRMVRQDRLELRALVPEVDLVKVHAGQVVRLSADMKGTTVFSGQVREVSPLVDEKTRLGTVRIDINESSRTIHPGQFFHGYIELGKQNIMLVPSKSVLVRDEKSIVFLLQGNKAFKKEIQIGEPVDDEIEVLSGLSVGQAVVLTGAGFLKDGDIVSTTSELADDKR